MAKHTIKILGKGCGACLWTERLVRDVVAEAGADVAVEKVTKTSEMVPYAIMSTPAIVIDERVVHAGGIPTKGEVERWLAELGEPQAACALDREVIAGPPRGAGAP